MAIGEKSKMYQKNPEIDLELLAHGIEQYLIQREEMVCQILRTPGGYTIQTKKKEDWKKYVMLDNATQINLSETDQFISVHIGGGKWVSKAAAAGVGAIIVWPIGIPLIALSSMGAFGLFKLPDKILEFIDQFMMSNGKCIVIPPYDQSQPQYGNYSNPNQYNPNQYGGYQNQYQNTGYQNTGYQNQNQQNPPPLKFGGGSGSSSNPIDLSKKPETIECPSCHKSVPNTSKFCPECGEKLS